MWYVSGFLVFASLAFAQSPDELFNAYESSLNHTWDDHVRASQKLTVDYLDKGKTRVQVDYERGLLIVDQVAVKDAAPKTIQEVLPELSAKNESAAPKLTELALSQQVTTQELQGGASTLHTEIPFISTFYQKRALKLLPIVREWAKTNQLGVPFVMAIIRQESGFNPRAKSWVPAYGLMQIVPESAGKEVNRVLLAKNGPPTAENLYDPSISIAFGTTYLKRIRDVHFATIQNDFHKHALMICAYNWGPGRALRLYEKRPELRSLARDPFLSEVSNHLPAETKLYLKRVLQFEEEFKTGGFS